MHCLNLLIYFRCRLWTVYKEKEKLRELPEQKSEVVPMLDWLSTMPWRHEDWRFSSTLHDDGAVFPPVYSRWNPLDTFTMKCYGCRCPGFLGRLCWSRRWLGGMPIVSYGHGVNQLPLLPVRISTRNICALISDRNEIAASPCPTAMFSTSHSVGLLPFLGAMEVRFT
jgi:hypothetical protein